MRRHFFVITISISLLIFAGGIFAQGEQRPAAPIESSFEITLSVVAGSNDTAQRGELPQALAPVSRQLRAAYGLSNLRLVDSYIGRIGNNGAMSYKSLANIDGNTQSNTPSFLDWQIAGLRNAANGAAEQRFYSVIQVRCPSSRRDRPIRQQLADPIRKHRAHDGPHHCDPKFAGAYRYRSAAKSRRRTRVSRA